MSYRILLVDADPDSLNRVRQPLVEAGYEIIVATDGTQAMEEFDRNAPDLTMVQTILPRQDGFSVCQELKKHPSGKNIPVMILHDSTKSGSSDDDARKSSGCDEYVEKPIDDDQLLEICKRLLEGAKASVELTKETEGLLGKNELDGALGTLESIIDSDQSSGNSTKEQKAAAAGDFSNLAAELGAMPLKATTTAPIASVGTTPSTQAPDVKSTPVTAAPAAPTPAAPTPVTPPMDGEGSDISSHLDALFSGGLAPSTPAATPSEDDTAEARVQRCDSEVGRRHCAREIDRRIAIGLRQADHRANRSGDHRSDQDRYGQGPDGQERRRRNPGKGPCRRDRHGADRSGDRQVPHDADTGIHGRRQEAVADRRRAGRRRGRRFAGPDASRQRNRGAWLGDGGVLGNAGCRRRCERPDDRRGRQRRRGPREYPRRRVEHDFRVEQRLHRCIAGRHSAEHRVDQHAAQDGNATETEALDLHHE